MTNLTIPEIIAWEIDYPVSGDNLTTLGAHHVNGKLWS